MHKYTRLHDEALAQARRDGFLVSTESQSKLHYAWFCDCDHGNLPSIHCMRMRKYWSVRFTAWPDTYEMTPAGQSYIRMLAAEHGGKIQGCWENWVRIDRLPEQAARQIARRLATWIAVMVQQ